MDATEGGESGSSGSSGGTTAPNLGVAYVCQYYQVKLGPGGFRNSPDVILGYIGQDSGIQGPLTRHAWGNYRRMATGWRYADHMNFC